MSSPAVRSNEGALQLSFRQAQAADALSLHALATQVFLDTYATEGVRPALAREAEQRYSTSAFLELLERPAGQGAPKFPGTAGVRPSPGRLRRPPSP